MDTKALFNERVQIFHDAVRLQKRPSRVPILGNCFTWKIYDAGYKLTEALGDYDIMEKVMRHYFETYREDAVNDAHGMRNPIQLTGKLGSTNYTINDENYTINASTHQFIEYEDYDAIIADPKKFIWEQFLPRKYAALNGEMSSAAIRTAISDFGEMGTYIGKVADMMVNEFGIPTVVDNAFPAPSGSAFEHLLNFMRGMSGLSRDMRKDPQKVLDACEALESHFNKGHRATTVGSCPTSAFDSNMALLAHTILSPKQFEKFLWPSFKVASEYAVKYDKTIMIFAEGDSSRFYEYFQELPKGHFAIYIETNDIFEFKKHVPNVCVIGGMPVDLLGKGTKEQCVDYAKKLLDGLAGEGGYIFGVNKMMSFPNDAKRENYKAVNDYVREAK